MKNFLNQSVVLSVSGHSVAIKGKLIDIGSDVVVLYDGSHYIYLPIIHMQHLTLAPPGETEVVVPEDHPQEPITELSYRKVLLTAKGKFVVLHISSQHTVHGYITSIMNDFFVFHSPMIKALYVSMQHLKMLIPYDPEKTPYAMKQELFTLIPAPASLSRTFDQQLRKLEGEFVVLDLGDSHKKIGMLKSVQNGLVELVTAEGLSTFQHIDHVKTIHRP